MVQDNRYTGTRQKGQKQLLLFTQIVLRTGREDAKLSSHFFFYLARCNSCTLLETGSHQCAATSFMDQGDCCSCRGWVPPAPYTSVNLSRQAKDCHFKKPLFLEFLQSMTDQEEPAQPPCTCGRGRYPNPHAAFQWVPSSSANCISKRKPEV